MDTDVNYLALAFHHHCEMLKAVFGSAEDVANVPGAARPSAPKDPRPPVDVHCNPIVLTPEVFDALAVRWSKDRYN
jgi:hypothetical protein